MAKVDRSHSRPSVYNFDSLIEIVPVQRILLFARQSEIRGSLFCDLGGGGFYTDRPPYKATALRLVSAEAGYRSTQKQSACLFTHSFVCLFVPPFVPPFVGIRLAVRAFKHYRNSCSRNTISLPVPEIAAVITCKYD